VTLKSDAPGGCQRLISDLVKATLPAAIAAAIRGCPVRVARVQQGLYLYHSGLTAGGFAELHRRSIVRGHEEGAR